MGSISFLVGASASSPSSIKESIYKLQNCSILFLASWRSVNPDLERAARVSSEAMACLDHIVNELLRARDQSKALKMYKGSQLQAGLSGLCGLSVSPVTRTQQLALSSAGPGNGLIPGAGVALTMDRLLNKIKHRRPINTNFRIDQAGQHFFIVAVDKPNHQPDSIVEFSVADFCLQCTSIAQYT